MHELQAFASPARLLDSPSSRLRKYRIFNRASLLLMVILTAMVTTSFHVSNVGAQAPGQSKTQVIDYDSFEKPGGYTLSDYNAKWSNPYGPGEMGVNDTRTFTGGKFFIDAAPFVTGIDYSVFDHIKYIAVSDQTFAVPQVGSITFSAEITAETPGTTPDRIVEGTYMASGEPYAAKVLQGQQAGVTLHMIDFYTGQLFDWFVSGNTAFTLIERLPSSITGSPLYAGRDKMYTQIIDEVQITPGAHTVAIQYTRQDNKSFVEFFLDGKRISKVQNVGVPLDVQKVKYTGIYPSLGPGEILKDQVNYVSIAHGLFSLIDAFPFQHPEAPELSVSIPLQNRIFGQGARGAFDNFKVIIREE